MAVTLVLVLEVGVGVGVGVGVDVGVDVVLGIRSGDAACAASSAGVPDTAG